MVGPWFAKGRWAQSEQGWGPVMLPIARSVFPSFAHRRGSTRAPERRSPVLLKDTYTYLLTLYRLPVD